MVVDMKKQYVYRNGRPARIICTDYKGLYPIVALDETAQCSRVTLHSADGISEGCYHDFDLIEVKEKFKAKIWINFYNKTSTETHGESYTLHRTREQADNHDDFLYMGSPLQRLACVEVEVEAEEGEGLYGL